jgi:hypothetical protein
MNEEICSVDLKYISSNQVLKKVLFRYSTKLFSVPKC